jgi:hypothetical protein
MAAAKSVMTRGEEHKKLSGQGKVLEMGQRVKHGNEGMIDMKGRGIEKK